MSKAAGLFFSLLLICTLVRAEGTRTWEQSKFDDLSKGTAKGVAIRSTGGLELAPSFQAVFATPSTYIWAIASDSSGVIYAASGAPARVYRVTPDGKAAIIFEAKELQVQSIVAGKAGVLYAATNPDGKIYKIEHKLGRVFRELEPYPLFPLSEYFNGPSRVGPALVPRLPSRAQVLGHLQFPPIRRTA